MGKHVWVKDKVRIHERHKRHECKTPLRGVCGRIFQTCDGRQQTYFTAVVPTGPAIARVQNDSSCPMTIIYETRHRCVWQTVEQGQQVSISLPSLKELRVECGDYCTDGRPACRGTYDIQWCDGL